MDGEFFCPRPELERQLKAFAASGQNVVVQGERRMGKTSLIRHAIRHMRKMRMLYIDLYCIRTLSDFCRRATNGIIAIDESMPFIKKVITFLHQLRPTLSFDVHTGTPQISLDAQAAENPDSLGSVMGMIQKLAKDGRICVVFDEFQDILDIDRSDVILAEMRSTIQFQPDTPYFFSGSVRNDMMRIFDDSKSPFFKSAVPFTVGPIEGSLFEAFIMERFREGDRHVDVATVRELIRYADSVTGDVQELCEAIWDTTSPKAKLTVADIPRALECIFAREGEAFGESVRQLTPLQVSVLRALAELDSVGIFSEAFMRRVGTMSTGALRTAINRLVSKRLIYPYGGRYRFANPFFRVWLLKRM
ncbi:MAG: ATP-binding protein [Kiritimatiellae bacterium]|nr:ATP-binding protein [Kiritimatiellia bacterium]MBP5228222.1 ATP-binding protein [Kiritimatiellia bacterium]